VDPPDVSAPSRRGFDTLTICLAPVVSTCGPVGPEHQNRCWDRGSRKYATSLRVRSSPRCWVKGPSTTTIGSTNRDRDHPAMLTTMKHGVRFEVVIIHLDRSSHPGKTWQGRPAAGTAWRRASQRKPFGSMWLAAFRSHRHHYSVMRSKRRPGCCSVIACIRRRDRAKIRPRIDINIWHDRRPKVGSNSSHGFDRAFEASAELDARRRESHRVR